MAAFFGKDTPVTEITHRAIQDYLSGLTKTVKRTTANKHRACLRRMFQFATEHGYVRSSATATVQRLKHDGRIHNRYLTPEEFRCLREAATRQRTARVGLPGAHGFDDLPEYLDLAISLATRPTETLTLKFVDVDWLNKQLAIRKTKNGKDRVLPLTDVALAALRTMLGKRHPTSDYVFHKSDGRGLRAPPASSIQFSEFF